MIEPQYAAGNYERTSVTYNIYEYDKPYWPGTNENVYQGSASGNGISVYSRSSITSGDYGMFYRNPVKSINGNVTLSNGKPISASALKGKKLSKGKIMIPPSTKIKN